MPDHTVHAYDDELTDLARKIAEMGGLAEEQIAAAVAALAANDVALAQEVIEKDQRIDRLHREVEDGATLMIARRQPMALDLRDIVGAMQIASDLERVGDLAKNTAKRVFCGRKQLRYSASGRQRRAYCRAQSRRAQKRARCLR